MGHTTTQLESVPHVGHAPWPGMPRMATMRHTGHAQHSLGLHYLLGSRFKCRGHENARHSLLNGKFRMSIRQKLHPMNSKYSEREHEIAYQNLWELQSLDDSEVCPLPHNEQSLKHSISSLSPFVGYESLQNVKYERNLVGHGQEEGTDGARRAFTERPLYARWHSQAAHYSQHPQFAHHFSKK